MRVNVNGGVDKASIERLVNKLRSMSKEAQKELLDELNISAQLVRSDAIMSIREPSVSGGAQVRYGLRRIVHPALAGNPPNWDTGTLANNIITRAVPDDLAFEVVSRAEYSAPLEFGFRDVNGTMHGPWPFMFPAFERNKAIIRRRIANGLRRAFQRARDKR